MIDNRMAVENKRAAPASTLNIPTARQTVGKLTAE
jgi:hypothetical protein